MASNTIEPDFTLLSMEIEISANCTNGTNRKFIVSGNSPPLFSFSEDEKKEENKILFFKGLPTFESCGCYEKEEYDLICQEIRKFTTGLQTCYYKDCRPGASGSYDGICDAIKYEPYLITLLKLLISIRSKSALSLLKKVQETRKFIRQCKDKKRPQKEVREAVEAYWSAVSFVIQYFPEEIITTS
jgi:hypothetical protein